MEIRVATPDDRGAVVETVVAAFRGDPAWGYMLGDDFERLAGTFATALFDARVAAGTVWVAETPAVSVAMWDAPGGGGDRAAWQAFRSLAGHRVLGQLDAYNAACAAVAPSTPHWYLGVLATHPDHHGRGLATAVMTPGLRAADHAGTPACLETSRTANVEFYGRRGFTTVETVAVPEGPATWWLTRQPQT